MVLLTQVLFTSESGFQKEDCSGLKGAAAVLNIASKFQAKCNKMSKGTKELSIKSAHLLRIFDRKYIRQRLPHLDPKTSHVTTSNVEALKKYGSLVLLYTTFTKTGILPVKTRQANSSISYILVIYHSLVGTAGTPSKLSLQH